MAFRRSEGLLPLVLVSVEEVVISVVGVQRGRFGGEEEDVDEYDGVFWAMAEVEAAVMVMMAERAPKARGMNVRGGRRVVIMACKLLKMWAVEVEST